MPKLRDYFKSDIDQAFFNANEFAELAQVDGKEVLVQIDEERLKEKANADYGGISTGLVLYFIKVTDLPERPRIRNQQLFNNRLYWIDDVLEVEGIYEITLNQNRGE
jgi:hypothetical protein